MSAWTAGALYNGAGQPLRTLPLPPYDGPLGIVHTRPVCNLLGNANEAMPLAVDLIYFTALDSRTAGIDPLDLAELVTCMDRGGWIALHGADEGAVEAAAGAILSLSGGGRA